MKLLLNVDISDVEKTVCKCAVNGMLSSVPAHSRFYHTIMINSRNVKPPPDRTIISLTVYH